MSRRATLIPFFALVLLSCDQDEPPIPEMPTYTTDVRPILERNCVRCHNETLSGAINPINGALERPSLCHLNRFESTGDCSDAGIISGACSLGAQYCGTLMPGDPPSSYITTYAVLTPQDSGGMPPLPAAPLSAREKEIIRRWSTANPAP